MSFKKVKLRSVFRYSHDGLSVIEIAVGTVVEGDCAKAALAAGVADEIEVAESELTEVPEVKKTATKTATKAGSKKTAAVTEKTEKAGA